MAFCQVYQDISNNYCFVVLGFVLDYLKYLWFIAKCCVALT